MPFSFAATSSGYFDAVAFDPLERIALVAVGTGQLKALAVQDLCQRAHSRAAYADKVDSLDIIQKMIVIHIHSPYVSCEVTRLKYTAGVICFCTLYHTII